MTAQDLRSIKNLVSRYLSPEDALFDDLVSEGSFGFYRALEQGKDRSYARVSARNAIRTAWRTLSVPVSISPNAARSLNRSIRCVPLDLRMGDGIELHETVTAPPIPTELETADAAAKQDAADHAAIEIIREVIPAMRDQEILIYRGGLNGCGALDAHELAKKFGITPRRVNQIFASGLRALRAWSETAPSGAKEGCM